MRGEKSSPVSNMICSKGSPPHARGKDIVWQEFDQDERITPACAGKSICYKYRSIYSRDHPRMRGEKRWKYMEVKAELGSPPHARGKVVVLATVIATIGITPACAGKSIDAGKETLQR